MVWFIFPRKEQVILDGWKCVRILKSISVRLSLRRKDYDNLQKRYNLLPSKLEHVLFREKTTALHSSLCAPQSYILFFYISLFELLNSWHIFWKMSANTNNISRTSRYYIVQVSLARGKHNKWELDLCVCYWPTQVVSFEKKKVLFLHVG